MTDLIRNRTPALPSISVLAVILAGIGAMAATLVESSAVGAGHAGALARTLGLVLPHARLESTDILGLLAVVLLLAVSVSVLLAALWGFDRAEETAGDSEGRNDRASVL
ncbi:hypothetical protein ACRC7T_01840 [Segnochrobactraceae bacterium EtOH-i3]